MDIREILEYLPHRYPMLLLDRVLECEPGKRLLGLKNVTMNELFFTGHFPHYPVMPGVMIIEALAQPGHVVRFRTTNRSTTSRGSTRHGSSARWSRATSSCWRLPWSAAPGAYGNSGPRHAS